MFKSLLIVCAMAVSTLAFSQDSKETEGSVSKSLNEVVVSASKKSEKILNAPASVSKLSEERIMQNTSITVIDNVKKIAAVDVAPTGLVSSNVVIRGFNNIFSGQTMYLVDNRMANVPSLRVNAFQLVPTSNTDISSIEIVRGPASALYGPFAANGVMAVFTKSTLDMKNRMEITTGLTAGFRSNDEAHAKFNPNPNNSMENLAIFNPEIRIAGKLSKTLGVKFSGNYTSASDYAFYDDREPNGKTVRFGNQSGGNAWASDGTAAQTYNRDFKIKKVAGDMRLDWRPSPGTDVVFNSGFSNNTNMELTGLGAAQAKDWLSNYFQGQLKRGKFFFQYYYNTTKSGNTYLIPQSSTQSTFTYLKENSNFQSAQVQHSSTLGKLNLVYGADYYLTTPKGNVYGRFDGNKRITQYGGYMQGDYKLAEKWSTTVAARMDYQDAINEWMFSPRAALVFKPKENQTFRATYNRSFTAPTALNFYLDLNNGTINNGSIRGFGNATGLNYQYDANDMPQFIATDGSWQSVNQATVAASAAQSLQKTLTGAIAQELISLGFSPASAVTEASKNAASVTPKILQGVDTKIAPLVVDFNTFNNEYKDQLSKGVAQPTAYASALSKSTINPSMIVNKESVKSTVTQTAELGYKGIINDRLSLGIDLYYNRMENFISPLSSASYQVLVGMGSAAQAQLISNITALSAPGSPALPLFGALDNGGNRNGTAIDEIIQLYSSPAYSAGTVAPTNTGTGSDVILTYLNLGTVDYTGADLQMNYQVSKDMTLEGAFSFINKNKIPLAGASGGFASLNAPQYKSALSMDYKLKNNLTFKAGWRWMDQFDANTGVYVGRVNATNFLDLGFTWKPSSASNTILALNVNNVMDHRHAFFPNSSAMGRVVLFKILHTFGVK